jgi:hypothetical protein
MLAYSVTAGEASYVGEVKNRYTSKMFLCPLAWRHFQHHLMGNCFPIMKNSSVFTLYPLTFFIYLSPLFLYFLYVFLSSPSSSPFLYIMYSYPLFLFLPPLPPRFSIYIFPRPLPLFTNLFFIFLSLDSSISFFIYLSSSCTFPYLFISTLSTALLRCSMIDNKYCFLSLHRGWQK